MRILSKTADAAMGTMLEADGGNLLSITEQGAPTGTSVIVEDLFANVPARRKFLKKDVTESMAVVANVEKIALSHPEIAIRLIVDGSVRLETAGDGNLRNTVYSVFGKEFASRLIEVKTDTDGIGIHGFIGRSDNFKANRNYENFFINGRYVKSKTAMAALEQAYTSYMPPEKFPACVLFLTLSPNRVDVNVHPAKLEVKFSNEKPIFEAIYYTVRTALEQDVTRPELRLAGEKKNRPTPNGTRLSEATTPIVDGPREKAGARQLSYDLGGRMQPQPQERIRAEEFREKYAKAPALTDRSLPAIGRVFGRDHTTIINSIETVEKRMASEPAFDNEIKDLINRIKKR
jgi:DNA mismatch repair protein MutL